MRRSIVLFSGLALILLVLISCSLKIPGSPVWMIEVTVPFSQRTYRLEELITDPGKLGEDKYGLLYGQDGVILEFVWEDSIEYDRIGDERMTYGASEVGSYVNTIDTIKIEATQTDTSILSITDFLPDSLIGKTGIVREFEIPPTESQLHYSTFRWIDVQSGWAVFRIENYFPCPVDSITLTIYNSQDDAFLGSLFIPGPIYSNSYIIDSLVVINRTVLSNIKIVFEGHATGTYRTKTITGEEEILIICGIAETSAEAVNAEIQVQYFTILDTLDYDDPNKLIDAVVSKGWIQVEIQNNLPLRLTTETHFTNIFTPDNEVLVKRLVLEPGSIENPSIVLDSANLTDHRMVMSLDKQAVFARGEVMSEDTRITRYQDSTFQTVADYQGVIGDYWLSKLYFKEYTGIIDSSGLDINTQHKETNLPNEIEDIDFVEDTLFLYMNNTTSMPLLMQINVEAKNTKNGRNSMISINDIILPGRDTIRVPDADRLITLLPDTITYYGNILLGARFFPEYRDSIITMTASDSIGGKVSLRSELKFTSSAKTIISDPVKLETSLDYPVESAKLNITLVNSIPLSGSIKLLMGTDTTDMTTLVDIDIPHGTIGVNHRAQAVHKTFVIDLGEAEFNIIKQDNVYTQQHMVFYGTERDTIWLYGADSLDVQATATIEYIVDPGDNYEE
ncbi:hypothetical protein HQ587_11445 [bacterium]|nr:hypothetical protein [bacterium]